MKKILVTGVAMAIAIAVNAATVSWQATAGWVSPNGDDALTGATFYLFDANVYALATFNSDIASQGASVFSNAIGSGNVTADGEVAFSGTGMTYVNDGSADWANAYGVIVATESGVDYYYMAGAAAPVKITSAILAGSKAAFAWSDDIVTGAVGTGSWSTVATPEPTSGLLMLLGMAGLALRRRRA